MTEDSERKTVAQQMAVAEGWDFRVWGLRDAIAALLRSSLADSGTAMDTGGGPEQADLWVTVGGVEYCLTVRISHAQRRKEVQ